MAVVVIGSEKGGTGKTTLAVNLAAARAAQGRSVLLVDADRQGSASQWASLRAQTERQPAITCVAVYGDRLADQVRALAERWDDVLIDTRGADAPELRSAMLVAHKLITPVQASQFDLFTMGGMDRLVQQARGFNPDLAALVVLNRAPTHATATDAADAREMLADLPSYRIADAIVRERKAFRRCAALGCSVAEMDQADEKAGAEMSMLAAEVWA